MSEQQGKEVDPDVGLIEETDASGRQRVAIKAKVPGFHDPNYPRRT